MKMVSAVHITNAKINLKKVLKYFNSSLSL